MSKNFRIRQNKFSKSWETAYMVLSHSREHMLKLMNALGFSNPTRSLRYSDSLTAFILYTGHPYRVWKVINVLENTPRSESEFRRLIPMSSIT